MRKKRQKEKVLPTPPITYRRIYSHEPGMMSIILILIFGLILLAFGINIFFATQDPRAIFFTLLIEGILFLILFGTFFGTLRSVIIDGENLVFAYRLKKNIYKASDIKSISWQTGLYLLSRRSRATVTLSISHRPGFPGDIGPSGHRGYGRRSFLLIEMGNGKKVEIPGSPYSRVDMQKKLLDWLEKYNPTAFEDSTIVAAQNSHEI